MGNQRVSLAGVGLVDVRQASCQADRWAHCSAHAASLLVPLPTRPLPSLSLACHPHRAGDHPLCRITLQPPLMSLLVPGGTLGVLLDFSGAHGSAADTSVQPSCSHVSWLLLCMRVPGCGLAAALHDSVRLWVGATTVGLLAHELGGGALAGFCSPNHSLATGL